MGAAQSLSLENHALHALRRSSSKNSFVGDKHQNVAEYPPLIVVKDSYSQTNVTYSTHEGFSEGSIVKVRTLSKWICRILSALLFFVVVALCSQSLQCNFLYMNMLNFPLPPLTDLNRFGLSDARNFETVTADGVKLRGWHFLPPGATAAQSAEISDPAAREDFFDYHLCAAARVVIYFHGNAGNRALTRRIDIVRRLSSHLGAHVISFDYRGFGDSGGWPSERGTKEDASAVWLWLQTRMDTCRDSPLSPPPPKVFLYGHSLGSAIATELAAQLSHTYRSDREGEGGSPALRVHGLVLDAPFSSVQDAIEDFPYAAPIRLFPFAAAIM